MGWNHQLVNHPPRPHPPQKKDYKALIFPAILRQNAGEKSRKIRRWNPLIPIVLPCWSLVSLMTDPFKTTAIHSILGVYVGRSPRLFGVLPSEIKAKNREWNLTPYVLKESSKGRISDITTVDGWNPAPPRMMIIPLFIGFQPSQVGCLGFQPSTVGTGLPWDPWDWYIYLLIYHTLRLLGMSWVSKPPVWRPQGCH